jgi:hypothetical protein
MFSPIRSDSVQAYAQTTLRVVRASHTLIVTDLQTKERNEMSSWKENQPNDGWAKTKSFTDPVTGKKLPQNPQGNATSLAKRMDTEVPANGGGRGGVNQAG